MKQGKEKEMRKRIIVVMLAAIFLTTATTAYAATGDYWEGMGEKLKRGFINVFTGWIEIPAQISKGYEKGFFDDENNKFMGAFMGIFTGVAHAAGRTVNGACEVAGFWAANYQDNDGYGLPLDAEYAWEEGTSYNIVDPDFKTAMVIPCGKKFIRGFRDVLFGIVEVPGQIAKGYQDGAADLGIFKGIWLWLSREVSGASDIATFCLPSPVDTKGYGFESEWPSDALQDAIGTEGSTAAGTTSTSKSSKYVK